MKDIDIAYVAGMLDGDGNIAIRKISSASTRKGYNYALSVEIGNTNEWLIRWIHFAFGGCLYKQTYRTREGLKPLWVWKVSWRAAAEFLRVVFPYLCVKKAQAELALQFEEKKIGRYSSKVPKSDGDLALEEVQRILMSSLNQGEMGEDIVNSEESIKLTKKLQLAYIGGIFDAEGSICIVHGRNHKVKAGFVYQLRVSVGNTNEWLIRWLQLVLGGQVFGGNYKGRKTYWYWSVASRQALRVLEDILPYLRIKGYQGEIAIKFQRERMGALRGSTGETMKKQFADLLSVANTRRTERQEAVCYGNRYKV